MSEYSEPPTTPHETTTEKEASSPNIFAQQQEIRDLVTERFGNEIIFEERRFSGMEQLFIKFKEPVSKEHGFTISKRHDPAKYAILDFIDDAKGDPRLTDIEGEAFQARLKRLYYTLQEFRNLYDPDVKKANPIPQAWEENIKTLIKEGRVSNDYLQVNNALVEHAIETNKEEMRKEFKIHLNPERSFSPDIAKKFLELLAGSDDLKKAVTAVKIGMRDRWSDETTLADVADIILYIEPTGDVEGTLQRCRTVLEILRNSFQEDADKGKETPPRNNFSINRMLYIAQSGGDMKSWLKKMKGTIQDPINGESVSMLDRFFDTKEDHAFFREDSERAKKLFSPLRKSAE